MEAQAREIEELKSGHAAEIAELRRPVDVLLTRRSAEGKGRDALTAADRALRGAP